MWRNVLHFRAQALLAAEQGHERCYRARKRLPCWRTDWRPPAGRNTAVRWSGSLRCEGRTIGVWPSAFPLPVKDIVDQGIHARCRDVRILAQVELGIEQRMRIANLASAVLQVVPGAIHRLGAQVRVGLPVPDRIHEWRIV